MTGISEVETFRLAIGHGHFTIDGDDAGVCDFGSAITRSAELGCSGESDGTVAVLSPRQWDFGARMSFERHDTRPAGDPDDWEQVSEERLVVLPALDAVADDGRPLEGVVNVLSPTEGRWATELTPGDYRIEISGRDFADGRGAFDDPEFDEGGVAARSEWRLRIWPEDGEPFRPRRPWTPPTAG